MFRIVGVLKLIIHKIYKQILQLPTRIYVSFFSKNYIIYLIKIKVIYIINNIFAMTKGFYKNCNITNILNIWLKILKKCIIVAVRLTYTFKIICHISFKRGLILLK